MNLVQNVICLRNKPIWGREYLKCIEYFNEDDFIRVAINLEYAINNESIKTNDEIGYVITDINQEYNKEVIKKLKEINRTIKLRVLY